MWQQIIELLTYDPSSPLLFNSGLFLVLFLLFVPVFYLLRRHHLPRTIWVVLFSLYFYFCMENTLDNESHKLSLLLGNIFMCFTKP